MENKRERLWKELLSRNLTVDDLLNVAEYNPTLRDKVWVKLLEQELSDEDLRYAIRYCGLANEAGIELLRQDRSKENLLIVVGYCAGHMADKAVQKLLEIKEMLNDQELRLIVRYNSESLSDEAGLELLKRNAPNNENFRCIIQYGNEILRNEVGKKLLERNPSNYDLYFIARYCEISLRYKAWEELKKRESNRDDLWRVADNVPRFAKEARILLNRSNEDIIAEMQMMNEGPWLRFKVWIAKL